MSGVNPKTKARRRDRRRTQPLTRRRVRPLTQAGLLASGGLIVHAFPRFRSDMDPIHTGDSGGTARDLHPIPYYALNRHLRQFQFDKIIHDRESEINPLSL